MSNINLLPWREVKREQEKRNFLQMLIISAIAAVLIVLLGNQYVANLVDSEAARNQRLKTAIVDLDRKLEEIKKLTQVRDSLIARMTIVHSLQERRRFTVHLFDELIKILPDGIYLKELKRVGDTITIDGYTESNTLISALMHNITQSPWLRKPTLTQIKKVEKDQASGKTEDTSARNEFTLSFELNTPTPLVEESK